MARGSPSSRWQISSQRGRHRGCHQASGPDGGQLDDPDPRRIPVREPAGQLERESRLAAPRRTDECDQADVCDEPGHLGGVRLAADEARQQAIPTTLSRITLRQHLSVDFYKASEYFE
jgi:hypothetical protein